MTQQTIKLTFDPDTVKAAPYNPSSLSYLLTRLVRGETVADGALNPWGIEVEVTPDRVD
ncbi:hypothetical protein [Novosphingopyxis sp. YJ-S2-01]|uniref:hypothetical protein n=1 Tax=Novosphingopyxis sp. YJ-S2-01 TaxID=2794021 RepID=UPI0018DE576B|nr:hypothetical protein [Novosphingopyxis sp. YJ-S2-01]MBH9537542.1 hypothetical protein [Novosphingopyxis sp. YJ-S2-01]